MATFTVTVTVEDGIWTAECDVLGLVTESDSYEGLVSKALEITPEMAEINGVELENFMLHFVHDCPVDLAA